MQKLVPSEFHSFMVEDAVKHGVEKAIIIQHLRYWLRKNKANRVNFALGYWWTYNSTKAFAEIFPYLSEKSIQRWLLELEKEKVLISGNFNKTKFDRTKWYSINEPEFTTIPHNEESKVLENPVFEVRIPQNEESIAQNEQPIPYIESDIDSFSFSLSSIKTDASAREETPILPEIQDEPQKNPTAESEAKALMDSRRIVLGPRCVSPQAFVKGLTQAIENRNRGHQVAVEQFLAENKDDVIWWKCNSQKNEAPFDHDMITEDFLKAIPVTKPLAPQKIYVGVKPKVVDQTPTTGYQGKLTMEDFYIYLYPLEWLQAPKNYLMVENLYNRCGNYVQSYQRILEQILAKNKPTK
jgi:hypothetical protein